MLTDFRRKSQAALHYLFFSSGTWEGNASFVRMRELGKEMLVLRPDIRISYLADDLPYNRNRMPWPKGAEVHFVPEGGLIRQSLSRRRLLRELRPDFIHILNPHIKPILALPGRPLQRIVGDWDEWPAERRDSLTRMAYERFCDVWMRHRAVLRVVASKYMQREFKRRFNMESLYLPYATYLTPQPTVASPFTRSTAVYIGAFFPAYDHDLIFHAAVILRDRGVRPDIVLLGGGLEFEKWRQFVRDQDLWNVKLPGHQTGDTLWAYLQHAEVCLFPIRETIVNLSRCPSKTYAYAQTRRPIITNRVGEVAEVLGDRATYVKPTPEAFAQAIERALVTAPNAPAVDYGIERHNWTERAKVLLSAIDRIG